jgi:dodecin
MAIDCLVKLKEQEMNNNVYKMIEVTGTSNVSTEDAIRNAIARAAKTVRHMRWFEVIETRGSINDSLVTQWQVMVKIGFNLEE